MSEKQKRKNLLTGIVLLAVIGLAIAFMYNAYTNALPPTPDMVWVDTDGDGVNDTRISFSMFQALRVVYSQGDSWKYPHSRTSLLPLSIVDSDTNKAVTSLQAYIYFNLISTKQVSKVIYTADLSLDIYNTSKTLSFNIGARPIYQEIMNPQNNTETIVTSSTLSASDFQHLAFPMPPIPTVIEFNAYYVISCSNIVARVTFVDGTEKDFGLTGVQATENLLWWEFKVYKQPWELSSVGVEWVWR